MAVGLISIRIIDPNHIEAFLFLAAGQETTARTLSWGVKRLARSPRVQEKLRRELMDAGLNEREMTFDDVTAEAAPCKHLFS